MDIKQLLPQDFAPESRVWIYQSNRPFSEQEELEINEQLEHFTAQWQAHGAPVKGWGKLLFGQVIVMIADETNTAVSGCSTDSSVRVIKSIERQYNANLFDRLLTGFIVKDKVQLLPLSQVSYALEKGYITTDTLYLNNTVLTKQELDEQWLVPLKDSWLMKRLQSA
ncbi:hypothetical protein KTO58_14510 [Chitinophaga pendula]|uniref:hypothetical protein n=1 Tax=Chitinophaga TaxID=79328 RepID=UPI000BB007DC|nr:MULTISPECIES: hypothetical protein [Chitinophaga]ASZ12053.1 hypothetical protein CK934_14325 [Chitinophaga sp. MD30]UCJ04914.1 hypothetical protein KTO58_14510 [Chitinophaga pendula]